MNKPGISALAFVVGIALMLVAALIDYLGAMHILTAVRLTIFVLGAALIVIALESMNVFSIREHLAERGHVYYGVFSYSAFVLTAGLVLAAYVFFISLGKWTNWPPSGDYYDRLAAAFASGHLYLKELPSPGLLALPNPYDPDARAGIPEIVPHTPTSIWDMSLYNGKVYPYWGPVPALLLIPLKLATGLVVGDQVLTLAFLSGAFILESLLLIGLWRRFFDDLPSWTVVAGMLVAAFVNPVPWLLFSPRIYEAAIAAGQFFFMGGLCAVLAALDRESVSKWRLALAAVLWACAVASRATVAVAVAFLGLLLLLELLMRRREEVPFTARLGSATAFAVPLLAGALLIGWYNLARFGNIFEFGFRYAITMLDQNRYHAVLFSPVYWRENAALYLMNRPVLDNLFPFVKPVWNQASIAEFNRRIGGIYNAERMIGLVYAAPFLLLGLLAPALALIGFPRRTPIPAGAEAGVEEPESTPFARRLIIALSALAVVELAVVFLVFYGTMRYFMDAVPTLVILAMLGFWLGLRRLRTSGLPRAAFGFLGLALMLITVVMGVLVGFSSDVPRLKAANPWLLPHLRLFFMSLAQRIGR